MRLISLLLLCFVYLARELSGLVGAVLDLTPQDKIIWDLSRNLIMLCLRSWTSWQMRCACSGPRSRDTMRGLMVWVACWFINRHIWFQRLMFLCTWQITQHMICILQGDMGLQLGGWGPQHLGLWCCRWLHGKYRAHGSWKAVLLFSGIGLFLAVAVFFISLLRL